MLHLAIAAMRCNNSKWSENFDERSHQRKGGVNVRDTGLSGAMSAAAVALTSLLIFATYTAAVTRIAFQWTGQPHKLPLAWGSNTWFFRPTRIRHLNGISIRSYLLAVFTIVTDTQTDHATPSVAIGRI